MSYKNIPFGNTDKFNVVIEIPRGSENKYEYDEGLDVIKLDWVFSGGFCFPFDYGFIPETRGGDGDHLDAFVFCPHPIAIGTIVECRAIGMIELLDRREEDNKILAVPISDPKYKNHNELADLNFDYKNIFGKFFKDIGIQKSKILEVKGFRDKITAVKKLESAHKNFK